jgi:glyoxylase-like metal-dependent hydrolase (beta-lactamase superfamily II)
MFRVTSRVAAHAAAAILVLVAVAFAVRAGRFHREPAAFDAEGVALDGVEPEIAEVRAGIFLIVGAGGNIVVQTGDDGVVLVDTQYAALGPKNLAAIRSVTAAPIRYVINTHGHTDHVGGNAFFRGYDLTGQALRDDASAAGDTQPAIIAHESAAESIRSARFRPSWLPSVLYRDTTEIDFNGGRITLLHQPAAHTAGDTIVVFENARVIAAGDIYNGVIYPIIDRWKGGSVQGLLAALDRLVELTTTQRDAGTEVLVIPGHGAIAGAADVAAYRDMVATIVERIERMAVAGMSLEQIQAARPTLEYDRRYGRNSGNWTTADFVAAVHHDLAK